MSISVFTLLGTLTLFNVSDARRLYDGALYDDALAALGASCEDTLDPVPCEEIRAFVCMGLGREADAAAAFERMLAREPSVTLSSQVAPKIRALFESRQTAVDDLLLSRLEPLVVDDDLPAPVKFISRGDVQLRAVTLVLRGETGEPVERIPMTLEGGAWIAMVTLEEPDQARHAVELELAAGATLRLGGAEPATPFAVRDSVPERVRERDWRAAGETEEDQGLPSWAWWGIVGGGAVVTGVVLALALGGGADEGDLVVDVRFDGAAP